MMMYSEKMSMKVEILTIDLLAHDILRKLAMPSDTTKAEDASRAPNIMNQQLRKRLERILYAILDVVDIETSDERMLIHYLSLETHLYFQLNEFSLVEREEETMKIKTWFRKLRVALDHTDDVISDSTPFKEEEEGMHDHLSDYTILINEKIALMIYELDDLIAHRPIHPDTITMKRFEELKNDSYFLSRRLKDEEFLIELLLREELEEAVCVIPVLGQVGFGKTKLAKLVYNNDRVQNHFDITIWVPLCDCYPGGVEFTKNLISECLNEKERMKWEKKLRAGKKGKEEHLEYLQSKLSVLLLKKKLLLILDGVSNEICCEWHLLKIPLTAAANGSRVLVTTRSTIVSSVLGTVHPYTLEPLSYKDSLSLFIQTAFGDNQSGSVNTLLTITMSECCSEMVKLFRGLSNVARAVENCSRLFFHKFKCHIGEDTNGYICPRPPSELLQPCEEVVKLFRGCPSIILAFGILVRHCLSDMEKSKFLGNLTSYHKHTCRTSSTLLWTYHGLSSTQLKKCFVYCGLFPKGYRLERHKLVLLWMAEGFLQPKCGMRMEDLGFAYFDELLQKSFLHITSWSSFDEDGPVYVMPDDVHDLADFISSSSDEYFKAGDKIMSSSLSLKTFEYARHSSLSCVNVSEQSFVDFYKSKGLHTLLICATKGWKYISRIPQDLFLNLTHIRVLDLSRAGLLEFPESICDLSPLRYLDLSFNFIKYLPVGITRLHNLQTLRVKSEVQDLIFPIHMEKLQNLRHLDMGFMYKPFVMPQGIGKLTHLQTLRAFAVGEVCGRIEELRGLVNLRGSLVVLNLDKPGQYKQEIKVAGCLVDKKHLRKLELIWNSSATPKVAETVLAGLEPHTHLRDLMIRYYPGVEFPAWVGNLSFFNLESIQLITCQNCELLPSLGQLPSLKYLHIHAMPELKHIDGGFCGSKVKTERFPSLKTLDLQSLPALETWTGLVKGDMPLLEKLHICYCEKLVSLPTLRFLGSLQELHICGCPKLQMLPDKKLPQSVSSLCLGNSPLLLESCKKKKSWSKIMITH